jgi:hypothetical protein
MLYLIYMNWYEKQSKYFSKYPMFNALVHASGGIALGILIARPFDNGHPLQLALIFAMIAVLGHLIPLMMKKVK